MYLVLEDPLDLGSASAARHPLHANKAHAAARNLAHHITHGNKNVAATSGLCTSITPTWSTMASASASASDESASPRAATAAAAAAAPAPESSPPPLPPPPPPAEKRPPPLDEEDGAEMEANQPRGRAASSTGLPAAGRGAPSYLPQAPLLLCYDLLNCGSLVVRSM